MNGRAGEDGSSTRLLALLALAIGLISFGRSIYFDFVQDDFIHIRYNPAAQGSPFAAEVWTSSLYPGNLYRPVTIATYAVDNELFGPSPLPYHATNVLLHFAVTLTAFMLLRGSNLRSLAPWTAMVFLALPMHIEAVANIAGRGELLAALFGLGSLCCLAELRPTRIAAGIALATLACGSKESALTLVAIPLVFPAPWSPGERVRRSLCYGIGAAVYLAARLAVLDGSLASTSMLDPLDNPLLLLGPFERGAAAFSLLGRSLLMTYVPWPLAIDYSHAYLTDRPPIEHLLTAIVAGAHVALLLRPGPQRFFAAFFFLTFALTSNLFIPIGTIFAERLAYLPSFGAAGLAAILLVRVSMTIRVFCVFFLAGMTLLLSAPWRSNYTLYAHQLQYSPQSAKSQQNGGIVLRNLGRDEDAIRHFDRALEIYPYFTEAWYALATIDIGHGRFDSAEERLNRALSISPDYRPALDTIEKLRAARSSEARK